MSENSTSGTYPGFGGKVGRVFATSESWWPDRPVPPENAPNIVIILCDDLGYADTSPYGSEIATPNIERLASNGLQYTNYHSTPMCSPTRAALLTGMNPHAAGVGTVAHADPGFPGYAMELADDVVTLERTHRDGMKRGALENLGELRADAVVDGPVEADEVHLVHGHHEVRDPEQARDPGMPARLVLDALPGVH